jgi:hypothetical protein
LFISAKLFFTHRRVPVSSSSLRSSADTGRAKCRPCRGKRFLLRSTRVTGPAARLRDFAPVTTLIPSHAKLSRLSRGRNVSARRRDLAPERHLHPPDSLPSEI